VTPLLIVLDAEGIARPEPLGRGDLVDPAEALRSAVERPAVILPRPDERVVLEGSYSRGKFFPQTAGSISPSLISTTFKG